MEKKKKKVKWRQGLTKRVFEDHYKRAKAMKYIPKQRVGIPKLRGRREKKKKNYHVALKRTSSQDNVL